MTPFPLRTLLLVASVQALASAQTALTTVKIAGGLSAPLHVTSPAGDGRLFVCEQNTARIKIVENGALMPTPFLDLGALASQGGEQGLLGLAFHPAYAQNGYFYVDYVNNAGDTVVARYSVSAGNPYVADPGSARVLLTVDQPFADHKAGTLQFGPLDGYLYVALGDGGGGSDPQCNAQNPQKLLGKILRLDVDGGSPYAVPADNPFVAVAGFKPEIWSLGWRNPWRFSFDALTGDLYFGDVGENLREEIDFEPALTGGRNYGWRVHEGTLCQGVGNCPVPGCGNPAYVPPVHEYAHVAQCAVIGGVVYRGCAIPDLAGTYFFADYCSNQIWSLRMVGGAVTEFAERTTELAPGGGLTINSITAFGTDSHGEIVIVDQGGELYRIVPAAPAGADCDGNGQVDACEIASGAKLDLDGEGTPDVCQALSADVGALSIASGGTQSLALHAGPAMGGLLYFVAGTVSGTAPGTPFGSVVVPLNFDAYLLFTLGLPSPPFSGQLGFLDASGAASASFGFAGGILDPGSAGLTFHHAYVTLGGATDFASNAMPVTLVP
jgi:glucose/arabinose dehydrogenase